MALLWKPRLSRPRLEACEGSGWGLGARARGRCRKVGRVIPSQREVDYGGWVFTGITLFQVVCFDYLTIG